MKITRSQLRKLIKEHLHNPYTREMHISAIMQDEEVPQKAKEALQSALDRNDEEMINSMLEMISNLTLDSSGGSKYAVSKSDFSSDDYVENFVNSNVERIKHDVSKVLSDLALKNSWLRYRVEIAGSDEPGEESGEELFAKEKVVNPHSDPYVTVSFMDISDLRSGKEELEKNGFRLAPQGLSKSSSNIFYRGPNPSLYGVEFPNRTVVSDQSGSFYTIKVKYK